MTAKASALPSLRKTWDLDTARIKHTDLNGEKVKSLWRAPIINGRCKNIRFISRLQTRCRGHRVVHGGREFSHAEKVNDHVWRKSNG